MFGYAIPFVMLWLVLFDHMDVVISDSLCALIALAMWMDALVSQPIALCVSFYDGLWITLQGAGVCWQHAGPYAKCLERSVQCSITRMFLVPDEWRRYCERGKPWRVCLVHLVCKQRPPCVHLCHR